MCVSHCLTAGGDTGHSSEVMAGRKPLEGTEEQISSSGPELWRPLQAVVIINTTVECNHIDRFNLSRYIHVHYQYQKGGIIKQTLIQKHSFKPL